jgi:hypothetical protein
MLSRALSDTRVAGHPDGYFRDGPPSAFPSGWEFWENGLIADRHGGVNGRREYVDFVYRVSPARVQLWARSAIAAWAAETAARSSIVLCSSLRMIERTKAWPSRRWRYKVRLITPGSEPPLKAM